ncbi:MAG: Nudix family hydrolase [Methylococcaceae bacterium]|nr:Nudix family hydrolase [Methylococcaceae bacterium]
MSSGQKPLRVAVAVIKNAQGETLISLRDKSLHQGGLWEFPGGKIEWGESPVQALVREIKEELDLTVISATPLITVNHQYPDLCVQLQVFLVEDFIGEAKSCEGQPFMWVSSRDLRKYSFPEANRPIITAACLPPYYAILDDADESTLIVNLHKILRAGVKLVQARLKQISAESVQAFIAEAYPLCQQHGVVLLINSAARLTTNGHVFNELSFSSGSTHANDIDGLHLTSQHLMARRRRPEHYKWLSASCHNLEELQWAERLGVDFVVLAPVFSTQTHPGIQPLGWEQFRQLVAGTNLPVYALGGMTKACLSAVKEAGGQGVAAIRAFL